MSALYSNGTISDKMMSFWFNKPSVGSSYISFGGVQDGAKAGGTTSKHKIVKGSEPGWVLNLKNVKLGKTSYKTGKFASINPGYAGIYMTPADWSVFESSYLSTSSMWHYTPGSWAYY